MCISSPVLPSHSRVVPSVDPLLSLLKRAVIVLASTDLASKVPPGEKAQQLTVYWWPARLSPACSPVCPTLHSCTRQSAPPLDGKLF